MKHWNRMKVLAGGMLLIVSLAGCGTVSGDDLYALPKQSDAYYDLQKAIDLTLPADASYTGPLTGSNQQAVQLADLTGDGHDEAIVFAKTSGAKPLKMYIFDRSSGSYENTAVIEGDGTAFDCVEYAQLDGVPGLEIVVGRQVSNQIAQSLGVYTYGGSSQKELMSAVYSEFKVVDLDENDVKEVLVLRLETEDRAGVAELYHFQDGLMERYREAGLTMGIKQIKRITTGYVARGVPAVFVASAVGENTTATDILTFVGKDFCNLAANTNYSLAAQKIRNYPVYATDIDEDGIVELPTPVALPSLSAEEETQWIIQWYNMKTEGSRELKMTTYHNFAGGWYIELPQSWSEALTVSREQKPGGAIGYAFSRWMGYDQKPEELFTIYALTGGDRLQQATSHGRTLLAEKGETAYAVSMGTSKWVAYQNEEDICAMFHFIDVDWDSGEI